MASETVCLSSVDDLLTAKNTDMDAPTSNTNNSFSPAGPLVSVKPGFNKGSSTEFAEQIKRLECEWHRFAAIASAINSEEGSFSAVPSPPRQNDGVKSATHPESPSVGAPSPLSKSTLAALMDVQADQKTIEELRAQLECQRSEAERLQRQLTEGFLTSRVTSAHLPFSLTSHSHSPARAGLPGSSRAFTTVPTSVPTSSLTGQTPLRGSFGNQPPSHLEKALKESQEQVLSLRRRLIEANQCGEQQTKEFRSTIEDLKFKLQETVVNRDRVLELRQKEASCQESLIAKLESNIQELQEAKRRQDLTIQEGNKKVAELHHHGYLTDSALSQIRLLLSDAERKRGKPYCEPEPISRQNPTALVHTLEKCLQDFDKEIDLKKFNIDKLQRDFSEAQAEHSRQVEGLTKHYQDRISQLVTDHAQQLEGAMERANNAKEQSTSLQTELDLLKKQYDQQVGLRDETIRAQEAQLEQYKLKHETDRQNWAQQRVELEQRIQELEEQLCSNRQERVELEGLLSNQQSKITQYEVELETLQDGNSSKLKTYEDLGQCKTRLEKQVADQQKEIVQLEKLLALSKQESSLQLQNQAATFEKFEKEKASERVNILTNQLSAMSQKADSAILDLGVARTEVNTLKLQVTELTDKLQATVSELKATTESKGHLQKGLDDKTVEIHRLSEERDYYCHLVDEKNSELGEIKSERDKVVIQLEENDRNLKTIYQQSTNLSQIVEINSKASDTVREEKENLLKQLTEKTASLEELKLVSENATKKLKSREKKLKELESEKQRHSLNSEAMKHDVIRLRQERDKAVEELKQYKYHATAVKEEHAKQLTTLQADKKKVENELKKMRLKYKAFEGELKRREKTLQDRQAKEGVDMKIVKFADKMQTEVTAKRGEIDKLNSQVRWMEERIEVLEKVKKEMEAKCVNLQENVKKLTNENKGLCEEIFSHKRKHQDLKVRASKLQSGLEKAAVKNSCAQREAEKLEQEITRLKINHKLEIKEAQSGGQGTKPSQPAQTKVSNTDVGTNSPKATFASPHQEPCQSLDAFTEIGTQLKSLLSEVKSLMSNQGIGDKIRESGKETKDALNGGGEVVSPKVVPKWELEAERINSLTKQHSKPSGMTEWTSTPSRSLVPTCEVNDVSQQSLSLSDISAGINMEDTSEPGSPIVRKFNSWHTNQGSSSHRASASYSCNNMSDVTTSASSAQMADTWAMCKRLEAKMASLSEMGESLQRENKEMADLVKVQGKKLQRMRNSESKVHKKR
ncbi:coiled-coil domain-containing protein 158-like [Liolophura sinensis]|uniref:coiled-coil domain-containing protein 158-like n=1 Tax=Liolophura sinensis TaxID=3198878 RepID=UPI003157FD69